MSKSPSSKGVWGAIYARLQFYDRDHLRQFFAASAKFLIEQRCWDDRHPGTDFDHRVEIQAFHIGFEQLSAAKMRGSTALDPEEAAFRHLLIDAAGYRSKGLPRRVAKRKLGTLRNRVRRAFRDSRESHRGLRFYERVIRSTYLRTDAQARRAEARNAVDRIKSPSPLTATLPKTRRRAAS